MTIDFWGLGLQAVNVLILMWFLSRLFWRPIAGAIAKRQDVTHAMLEAAKAAQAKADATLSEVTEARDGIAAEREAVLTKAAMDAETATQSALAEVREKVASLEAAAQVAVDRNTAAAAKANAAWARDLSVDIAKKLLFRLNIGVVQTAFLDLLVEAIKQMPPNDRSALMATTRIDIVSATDPDDVGKAMISHAVVEALGGSPELNFVTDPEIIAGLEIRTAHFILHNSWQSDLAGILKELKNAA